jgi:vitamin B12 transporter
MKRCAVIAALAAIFLTLSVASRAQSAPDAATVSLDEVVVVANRAPEPLSTIGNSVTVLDAAAIQGSQAVAVADLLAQTPGVTLGRTGGIGAVTAVYIRGAESDQTAVVIDGVLVNDPSSPGGGFDFANLLTGNIARIEILRGAQSTLYGSQAMGGVVNIETADPTSPLGGNVSAEGGSHNTGYGTAALGGKSDSLSWELAGSYYGTSGIPDFDEALGGKRLCASQIGGALGKLSYDFTPDLQLDLRGYYTLARTDFDGYDTPSGNFGDDNEYGKSDEIVGYAGLTSHSSDHTFTNRVAFQYTETNTRDYDPDAPASYGSTSTETFYGIGRNFREEYQGTWDFSPSGHLTFGAQHERSTIDTDTPAYDVTPMPEERQVSIDSGYAQLQEEILAGLTLTAGARYDHHDVYGGHTTGQLAAAWALDDRQTILRASFGQGFKAPSLYQLYSFYGNSALRPEQDNSWDAGIERHAFDQRVVLSATYFQRNSSDLINFFSCPAPNPLCATEPQGFYANIARAAARGVELQGTFNVNERLNLAANYTLTNSEDRSPGSPTYGEQLPNRPKNAANASVTYHWPSLLSTTIALRYAGPSFDEAITPIWLGGYVVGDLRVSYPIRDRVEIYGRVENFTGKHYETNYEYGTLPRSGYVGVRATF